MTGTGAGRDPDGQGGYALFDTALGRCGIGWTDRGIAALVLPERTEQRARARLRARMPGAKEVQPPAWIADTVTRVVALIAGQPADLSGVALDMDGLRPFAQRVYRAARDIPAGATMTYGELAQQINAPGAARAVGQALGRNPFAIIVPCHRVTAAGGKLGGFSAEGGQRTKHALLTAEAARETPSIGSGEQGDPLVDLDAALTHLHQADPDLARSIEAAGPMTPALKPTQDVFSGLVEAIVYQQLSGKAAATIHARLQAQLSDAGVHRPAAPHERILVASDDQLRGVGLSRAKVMALRDLAERVHDGTLPSLAALHRMDDHAVIEQLTRVRGIGRWSAEMFLIFRLGRPDVLPAHDVGVRKGFARVFGVPLPTPEDVLRRGERWRPYRTVASCHLWRIVDTA